MLSDNFMLSFGDLNFFEPIIVFLLPRKPMYSLDVRGKQLSQAEQWPDASSLGKRASFKTSSPQGLVVKDLTIQVSLFPNIHFKTISGEISTVKTFKGGRKGLGREPALGYQF